MTDDERLRTFRARALAKHGVACVASVSVRFRSKERPRKAIFGFDRPHESQKMKEGGGGGEGEGEGRKRLQTNPSILKTCVAPANAAPNWLFPTPAPPPPPSLSFAPFVARSLTLVPRSLLLNHTETLATQAKHGDKAEVLNKTTVKCHYQSCQKKITKITCKEFNLQNFDKLIE